jgi:hypothetical protein
MFFITTASQNNQVLSTNIHSTTLQSVETPEGDMDLLQEVMNGANVQVDESAEERKGGADDLGKAFLSAGDKHLAVMFNVPAAVSQAKGVTMQEWIDALTAPVKEHVQIIEKSDEFCKLIVPGNMEAGRFPLKMRDECTAAGFNFLREKGLIPAEESSDDEDYAAAAGVEW